MFGLFRKRSAAEKLEIKYKKLLEESFRLSHTNRQESDLKRAEAEEILLQIESMKDS